MSVFPIVGEEDASHYRDLSDRLSDDMNGIRALYTTRQNVAGANRQPLG